MHTSKSGCLFLFLEIILGCERRRSWLNDLFRGLLGDLDWLDIRGLPLPLMSLLHLRLAAKTEVFIRLVLGQLFLAAVHVVGGAISPHAIGDGLLLETASLLFLLTLGDRSNFHLLLMLLFKNDVLRHLVV